MKKVLDIFDLLAILGFVSIGYGLWLWWHPALYIFIGAALILLGIFGPKRE